MAAERRRSCYRCRRLRKAPGLQRRRKLFGPGSYPSKFRRWSDDEGSVVIRMPGVGVELPNDISAGRTPMPFYENGDVRIHYEEAGSGFSLLLIPGCGLHYRMGL